MNINLIFGNRIKELRKSKNLAQRDLARKAGMDYTYLSKIENAKMPPPRRDVIERLAKALEADINELLTLGGRTAPPLEQTLRIEPARQFLFRHAPRLKEEDWARLLQLIEKAKRPS